MNEEKGLNGICAGKLNRSERKRCLLQQLNITLSRQGFNEVEINWIVNRIGRIMNYLINYTDISSLEQIQQDHLLKYIEYSTKNRFFDVSLRDIKTDVALLKFILRGEKEISIDFSINNTDFWTQILPCKENDQVKV